MKKSLLLLVLMISMPVLGQDIEKIIDLDGPWKFSIGDRPEWKNPDFDDSKWERINCNSSWENEGFHGYDGFAWYRRSFYLQKGFMGRSFYFQAGYIDDVDEVYLNGNLIGSAGHMPPDFQTAYNVFRRYPIPQSFLNFNGNNVIAIRVYDSELEGGMMSGDPGIYFLKSIIPDYNLEGVWKFAIGDSPDFKEIKYNDHSWKDIVVPGYWESFGNFNFDGTGWYRTEFPLPDNLKDKKLVLLMGKIDDLDEVYINGVKVGSTGNVDSHMANQEWTKFRGYYLPEGLLKKQGNVIAVRVYDALFGGGIYEGPIGLVRQEKYVRFWRDQKKNQNIFHILFGN